MTVSLSALVALGGRGVVSVLLPSIAQKKF